MKGEPMRRPILGLVAWDYGDDHERETIEELELLSDRAAAIVGCSYLEGRLEESLRYDLVDDPETVDDLLREPVGTFAARIKLARAIGLITRETKGDLDVIRKIRNLFTHDLSVRDFNSDAIGSRCANLKAIDRTVKGADEQLRDPRQRYFMAILHLCSLLSIHRPRLQG
jgi:hypothetical protein